MLRRVRWYRSHEEGDAGSIPHLFFDDSRLLDPVVSHDRLPRLFHALVMTGHRKPTSLGLFLRGVGEVEQGQGQGHEVLSVEGRKRTFSGDWHGPSPQRMAEAGFYRPRDRDSVHCAFCPVQFRSRGWQSGDDPWEKHRHLSSDCRLIRLFSVMGNRKLRHSSTSLHILGGL